MIILRVLHALLALLVVIPCESANRVFTPQQLIQSATNQGDYAAVRLQPGTNNTVRSLVASIRAEVLPQRFAVIGFEDGPFHQPILDLASLPSPTFGVPPGEATPCCVHAWPSRYWAVLDARRHAGTRKACVCTSCVAIT